VINAIDMDGLEKAVGVKAMYIKSQPRAPQPRTPPLQYIL